jgi:hypothetical protein
VVYELDQARDEQRGDPRTHADDVLARARNRDRRVVTLDTAGSPADSASTVIIPRYRVTAADPRSADPDSTQILRASTARGERI